MERIGVTEVELCRDFQGFMTVLVQPDPCALYGVQEHEGTSKAYLATCLVKPTATKSVHNRDTQDIHVPIGCYRVKVDVEILLDYIQFAFRMRLNTGQRLTNFPIKILLL